MASVAKREWEYNGIPNEAWVVRFKDAGGAHRSKQFKLKKQAIEYQKKVEREMEAGTFVARRASRTISDLIDEFLADLARRVEEEQVGVGYLEQTTRALGYAKPEIGALIVADLTWQQVEKYGRALRVQKVQRTGRALAGGTIRVALNCLNMAVSYGVRRGYALRNVVPDALKELGAMPAKPIETFSREEMQRLVATIENRPRTITRRGQAFMRAMVYLGAMCGLRRGEILALRWEEIDLDRGQITVRHNLTPQDVLKGPKTLSGRRTVPLPKMAADALRAWAPFVLANDRGLIFRNRNGGAWQDATFYRDTWHPLLNRAGIGSARQFGHKHFHATRHFAGSAWLAGGVPLPDVSRLLGHANVQVTARVYSHVISETHHRADLIETAAGLLSFDSAQGDAQELRKAA